MKTGHNGNLPLAENFMLPRIWRIDHPNFKYANTTFLERRKISVPCGSVIGRFNSIP